MKISFYTLGCKVNQFETQAMERLLVQSGHEIVPFSVPADVAVINTCAVTGESARKSRQAARRVKKLSPATSLVICGCYSQSDAEAARALGADFVSGSGGRQSVVDFINGIKKTSAPDTAETAAFFAGLSVPTEFEHLPPGGVIGHTRALLKVQDGCRNFCSYCIIPYLRGPCRSLPTAEAVADAKTLAGQGYREIVVTGIEISSYGIDTGSNLTELVTALCAAVPGVRIRLGSLEPRTVTEQFVNALATLKNLCPHFHLSLQSGCDSVLKRMNRRYTTGEYSRAVGLLRSAFPNCAVTTDLIVGFPGETDEEFSDTLAFISETGFSMMHIFPYSKREGTKAATMPGQLSNEAKAFRAELALKESRRMQQEYLDSQLGRTLHVLFETECEDDWTGHAENYVEVTAKGENLRGLLLPVRITGASGLKVTGELE